MGVGRNSTLALLRLLFVILNSVTVVAFSLQSAARRNHVRNKCMFKTPLLPSSCGVCPTQYTTITSHLALFKGDNVSPLYNLPLEDALEIELDELELELELDLTKKTQDTNEPSQQIKITDAASIIAGTAIGGGFLALPSVTAPIGYAPATLGLVFAWIFLLLSSTAFIEAAGLVADVKKIELSDENDISASSNNIEDGATSVATVIRYAFGKKYALVGGMLFIAQMLAVVTAQVVKGAELFSDCLKIPYLVGCLVPPALAGVFVFVSKPEVVERANTALTVMMVGGFLALIMGTITTGNVGKAIGSLFTRADYSKLLPNGSSWALPVFINMLCFGQSMPLVVERMAGKGTSTSINNAKPKEEESNDSHTQSTSSSTTNDIDTRASSLFRARKAAGLGAAIPLVLSVTWAAISTALISPSASNPLYSLLSMNLSISVPVLLLAGGAIGTTLLGSFLAMGHFFTDIISMKFGYCSRLWMSICNAFTVAVPSILACAGPSLYLPLLTFSGAYPTTILHGLSPALAALVLRRRARRAGMQDGTAGTTPRIVPGGDITLVALAGTAVSLIGASTYLAVRHMLRMVGT